jgi:hypothetical protein
MKLSVTLWIGLVSIATLAPAPHARAAAQAPPPSGAASAPAGQESPFACNALALSPAERRQHFDVVGPKLRALHTGVRELPNGYEFEFGSEPATYKLLSQWMLEERSCCPFFDLSLRLDREGGPMWLRLTGRDGVKEFITAEFPAAWFAKPANP